MVQVKVERFIELRYDAIAIVVLKLSETLVEILLRSVVVVGCHVALLPEWRGCLLQA